MSIENPRTLEEWKQFRFPYDDTPRPGMPGFITGAARPAPVVEDLTEAQDAEDTTDQATDSETGGGPETPAVVLVREPEPLATEPEDAPLPEEPVNSWSYDAMRGLLINWNTERMVSLSRHLNTLPMILRHLAIVEHRRMDHVGFMDALNRACQETYGKDLRDLIRALPKGSDDPIGWPETPLKEPLALIVEPAAPRRRPGVRA